MLVTNRMRFTWTFNLVACMIDKAAFNIPGRNGRSMLFIQRYLCKYPHPIFPSSLISVLFCGHRLFSPSRSDNGPQSDFSACIPSTLIKFLVALRVNSTLSFQDIITFRFRHSLPPPPFYFFSRPF